MSDNKIDLKSAMQRHVFVRPSENYLDAGTNIIRHNYSIRTFWNSHLGRAVSATLLLSLSLTCC